MLLLAISFSIYSCKNETKPIEPILEITTPEIAYASFGKEINDSDALTTEDIKERYTNLTIGDTINTKMTAEIIEVCSKKGCWMTLKIDDENEMMVKFKDYGFFMPLDADGNVIINGKAYIAETSVDELRHYAEDAGKTETEIAAITEPKFEYLFEADGVLLEQ